MVNKIFALFVVGILLAGCSETKQEMPALVIINAQVIDGTGGPSQDVAVRIVGQRVDAIGNFDPAKNDTIIDAGGLVLSPGFIDTHSHHDANLLAMPDALALVNQGVTTIVGGMDGGQEYPLAEFFAELEATPAAVNVASYAGHGVLRDEIMGEDYQRHATPEELAGMAELLRLEMAAGALGFATGLEYVPGTYSSTEELIALAKVAAVDGGRYLSHIRSEDQFFWDAIEEIITIGREAGLPVRVSHIKLAMPRWWGQAERLIARLNSARDSGVDITADIYPYRAWNAGFSWLVSLFPERDLERSEGARYILDEMLSPEGIMLATFPAEPAYDGLTVAQIAELRGTDPATTLVALLKADAEAGGESSMLGFAMDEPDIEAIMTWPHAVVASDGELAGPHPRGYGTFTRFLGHYVRVREVVPLEEGVRKSTSLPAQQVGIAERGLIKVGYFADLVLFDPALIQDRATFASPHLPSTGIAKVWVNGQLVYDDGRTTGARPGMVVRRPAQSPAP